MTDGTFANTSRVGQKIVPSRQKYGPHPDLVRLVRTFLHTKPQPGATGGDEKQLLFGNYSPRKHRPHLVISTEVERSAVQRFLPGNVFDRATTHAEGKMAKLIN
jgi:hypothetical protein